LDLQFVLLNRLHVMVLQKPAMTSQESETVVVDGWGVWPLPHVSHGHWLAFIVEVGDLVRLGIDGAALDRDDEEGLL